MHAIHERRDERDPGVAAPQLLRVVGAFAPDGDYRPVVCMVVAAAGATEPPVSASRLDDLRLAVTEACNNAAAAHRGQDVEHPVVVTCSVEADCVRVEVRDRGPGFDPDAVPSLPDPEDPERLEHEHGLGVSLICELADDVTFRSTPAGTVVSMAVDRPGPPG